MARLLTSLVIGSLVALSTPAAASDLMANMAFNRLDANGDGKLDAAELKQARVQRFERLDENHDGFVTEDEQMSGMSRLRRNAEAIEGAMATRFDTLDTNGDGRLSEQEFMASPAGGGLAARIDRDGDGAVSKEEFTAAIEAARAAKR